MPQATFRAERPPRRPRHAVFAAVVALTVAGAGCSALVPEQSRWPPDLPPLESFMRAYADDAANAGVQTLEDYLSWIYRFYKGWIAYAVGWLDIQAGVVASVAPERRAAVEARLVSLGRVIASEWAKASPTRVIYKQTLAAWGEVLTEAVNRGEVERLLDDVDADLELLFQRQLAPEQITTDRYYADLDDGDPFAP